MENKAEFVKAVGEALRDYSRENVIGAEYHIENGGEFVKVTYESGDYMDICVSGDSCIAILNDIYYALR